jgi:hypothetical protein
VVSRFMLVVSAGFIVCLLLMAGLTTPRSHGSTVDPAGLVGVKATYMCPPKWEWLTSSVGKFAYAIAPSPAFFYKYPEVLANITKAVEQLSEYVDASKLDAFSRLLLREAINSARELRDFDPGNGEYDIPLFSLANRLQLLSMEGVVSFNTTLWWHVIGFNGSHYTVILGVNLTLSVGRKTIGYGVVEEVVQVSAQDRTMYYRGEYAGKWPFFLMPHELYEGSEIELTDVILYRKYKGTEFKGAYLSATLSKKRVESSVYVIGGYYTYIKEKMGIAAERLLGGGISLALPGDAFLALHNATYSFIDELTGRKVLRAIRIHGIASVPITLGAIYDVSTGVAVEFAQGFSALAFDPLSYVIPLSAKITSFEGCSWFVLVDLRREEARTMPTTTARGTPKPPEATPTATAPVGTQTQVTPTTTPVEVTWTTTSPTETPATPPGVTTPATQPRPAPPIPATQPGPTIPAIPPGAITQAVDGKARGQEGLIAVELLTITLAVLSLTIAAVVAYRILVRGK